MATKKSSARRKPVAPVDDLPDEPAAVLREELVLIREEIADQARRVALAAPRAVAPASWVWDRSVR